MSGTAVTASRYRAFISYSHRDKAVAAWLHRTLESYRIPAKLVGRETRAGLVPRRLTPIFRDRDELPASGDLGGEIAAALGGAMFLVVICSPAAAASRWVDQEILSFKRTHGEDRVFALIAAGEPYASAVPATVADECFPRCLRFKLGPDGTISDSPAEPIAADLRPAADGRRLAKLKLVAGLTGLQLDDLVRRETQRRMRRLAAITTAAVIGMILAGALALYAEARRVEANQQRRIAEREAATALAASDYLVGTFALSNPATENPRTVTALTILSRSAGRARAELADQPVVQARLVGTLASAFDNLGLFGEARDALLQSYPAITAAGVDGVGARLTLATTYLRLGQIDRALATVREAEAILGTGTPPRYDLRALAALAEGRISTAAGKTDEGVAAFDRALVAYRAAPATRPRSVAVVLTARGLLLSDDGRFAAAEQSLSAALAINRRALGEGHLVTGQSWFALAQNAFLAGNLPLAETRIAHALAIERQMLDDDNPIIADTLSMQGQIFQGRKQLPEAKESLEQAVSIYRKAFGRPHYLIGIADVYLALVESDRGHTTAALAILDDAKHNYGVGYGKLHANHGDLLVNRATVLAHAGRWAEAAADCNAGVKILGQTLGPTANYTKSMAANCVRLVAGRRAVQSPA
ncbi:MAG: tetratricopeptide repeat protein [Janthinobacterium lividum]